MRTVHFVAVLTLALGCGGEAPPGQADDCWGLGDDECARRVDDRAVVLGITTDGTSPFDEADCGDPLTCNDAQPVTPDTPPAVPPPVTAGADEQPADDPATAAVGRPEPPDEDAVAAVNVEPPSAGDLGTRPAACSGIDVRVVSQRGTALSSSELACLRGVALDHAPLAIDDFTDLQMATIGLVNARDAQWPQAVERSLSYSELRNSPTLNFAGITPAFNEGRYPAVLQRANSVWSNLDKGYRLSAADRTFVAEYACRAGVQLHMQGQLSDDHERWCRIWVDRLQHEGGDASEALGLLERVE